MNRKGTSGTIILLHLDSLRCHYFQWSFQLEIRFSMADVDDIPEGYNAFINIF